MITKFEQVKNRVEGMKFTQREINFILADWPEGDEHLDWLLDASWKEIKDWINLPEMTYRVIEDNAGGLTLIVCLDNRVVYEHTGYEYTPGQLRQDLHSLDRGDDPEDFDGNEAIPGYEWDAAYESRGQVVADNIGGVMQLHTRLMGVAAELEFEPRSGRPALYGRGEPMVKSALYLRRDQLDWLKSQPGETASAVVRRLIDAAKDTGKPVLTDEK
jgi:hypothetical protein